MLNVSTPMTEEVMDQGTRPLCLRQPLWVTATLQGNLTRTIAKAERVCLRPVHAILAWLKIPCKYSTVSLVLGRE